MDSLDDPDVQILAGLAAAIAPDYTKDESNPWVKSPFRWILGVPSRSKGAIGERLIAGWCAANGFDVVRSRSSEADRIINGHRVEIKFSTLWTNGNFRFQQIRNQNYDYAFCIGISPFDAQAWLIPKAVLLEHVIGHMGQHTGASGTDTSWIGFKAKSPYEWMLPYGDRLADVRLLLDQAGRGDFSE